MVDLPVVLEVLLIFENRIEIVHALSGQKAKVTDHASDTPSSEGPSTKSDQDNFVTGCVVGRYEGINLANVLREIQSIYTILTQQSILTSEIPVPNKPPVIASRTVEPVPTPEW